MNTLFRIVLCALLCVLARGAAAEVITHNQVADDADTVRQHSATLMQLSESLKTELGHFKV